MKYMGLGVFIILISNVAFPDTTFLIIGDFFSIFLTLFDFNFARISKLLAF